MKTAAVIGISRYARYHLFMALEQSLHGRLRVAAVVVVNQKEETFLCDRLRSLGCEIFEDTATMWARWSGRIDLCLIPTGIHLHAPMTLDALAAGANVLVEKPLTATATEAVSIIEAERRSGRFVAVGFQDLYTPSTWLIKERLLAGAIGDLESITLVGLWPRHAGYYQRNEWAGRLKQNGQWVLDSPVNNAFAHFLNLGLFWAGRELAAAANVRSVECELYRAQLIENFDTCCIRAELEGGPCLLVYATHSCEEDRVPLMTVKGSRGELTWVQESHYEFAYADGRRERGSVPGKIETKLMMADAVLDRFDRADARICGTSIALRHLQLVDAVHQAGSIVDIPTNHVRQRVAASGSWREIIGIEAAIDRASREGRLWSELGVPWARSAGRHALSSSAA